jgi:hypothetical protein
MKKRTTVWLPEELVERLKKLSRKTGAPMADPRSALELGLSNEFPYVEGRPRVSKHVIADDDPFKRTYPG